MTKRIIKPIPKTGIELTPPNCAVVDQHYDYITENDDEDETGAVYIAKKVAPSVEAPGGFLIVLDKDASKAKHTFAGWPAPKGDKPVRVEEPIAPGGKETP